MDLPTGPGVYWFLDKQKRVLYVGKAKNLKNRLKSYSRTNKLHHRTQQLVAQTAHTRYLTTESELEALLTEAELIRHHQPHYNIRLKDDKSPLYIVFTKEEFPRLLRVRKNQLPHKSFQSRRVFGPYNSGYQVNKLLRLIRSAFPYCNASPTDKNKHKACFYYHLGLCPGACVGDITPKQYRLILTNLSMFLRGKKKQLIKNLESDIKTAIDLQDFETANRLKHQHQTITYLTSKRHSGQIDHPLPSLTQDTNQEMLIGLKRVLKKHFSLPSNYPLDRIEAYDVSNLQGNHATASMVVFTSGSPDNSQYRRFKIRHQKGQNDTAMIKQTLTRRFNHPEWGLPHLIVIDGGKGQLKAARSAVELTIPVVSIAKNPDRLIIISTGQTPYVTIPLKDMGPAEQLLSRLRDESHRFAKSYQSLLHSKSLLQS